MKHLKPTMQMVTHRQASVGGQKLKAVLHVDELPLDRPVVAAKVVERGIELLQQYTSRQLSSQLLKPHAYSPYHYKSRSVIAGQWVVQAHQVQANQRRIYSDMQMSLE